MKPDYGFALLCWSMVLGPTIIVIATGNVWFFSFIRHHCSGFWVGMSDHGYGWQMWLCGAFVATALGAILLCLPWMF